MPEKKNPSTPPADRRTAFQKGLGILLALGQARYTVGPRELARSARVSRDVSQRTLADLLTSGYAIRTTQGKYALSRTFAALISNLYLNQQLLSDRLGIEQQGATVGQEKA